MSLTSIPVIYGIVPHEVSEDQKHQLGVKGVTSDGRIYRYAQAADTKLEAGELCIAPDVTTFHEDVPVNTFAIGDTTIVVTLGAAPIVGNEYEEGFVNIRDESGEGIMYKIANCPAHAGGGDVTIRLAEPIRVVAVGATTVTLYRNKFRDIVDSTGVLDDIPVGVPNVIVPANYYAWIQRGGPCSVLNDATTSVIEGVPVTIGQITNGSVQVISANATDPVVGICPAGAVPATGEFAIIELTLG